MTLHPKFKNAVDAWYEEHGKVDCTTENGRNELKAQYRELYPDKTDKQANLAVTRAVRVVRGVMAPTKTPKRLVQKLIGAPTAHSSKEYLKANNKFNISKSFVASVE